MASTQENRKVENDVVLTQAAEWLMRMSAGGMTADDFAAWQRWLAQSESHRRAFRGVEDLREKVGQIKNLPWPTSEELNADRYEGQMPLEEWIGLQEAHPAKDEPRIVKDGNRGRRQPKWLRFSALAASVVMVMGAALWVGREFFDPAVASRQLSVKTEVGEHRELTLPDGSTVTVGARSRMSVQFTDITRSVLIESGEAYFTVANEASRPFVVHAGAGTITAVGTAFNVQQGAGRVVVTVVEGGVEVASTPVTPLAEEVPKASGPRRAAAFPRTRVQAGEQFVYGEGFTPVRAADPALAVAWRAGQLRYQDEPLKFVIPQVQRYTRTRLIIADARVGQLHITGTVFEGEVEDWLKSLERTSPVEIVSIDERTMLLKTRIH